MVELKMEGNVLVAIIVLLVLCTIALHAMYVDKCNKEALCNNNLLALEDISKDVMGLSDFPNYTISYDPRFVDGYRIADQIYSHKGLGFSGNGMCISEPDAKASRISVVGEAQELPAQPYSREPFASSRTPIQEIAHNMDGESFATHGSMDEMYDMKQDTDAYMQEGCCGNKEPEGFCGSCGDSMEDLVQEERAKAGLLNNGNVEGYTTNSYTPECGPCVSSGAGDLNSMMIGGYGGMSKIYPNEFNSWKEVPGELRSYSTYNDIYMGSIPSDEYVTKMILSNTIPNCYKPNSHYNLDTFNFEPTDPVAIINLYYSPATKKTPLVKICGEAADELLDKAIQFDVHEVTDCAGDLSLRSLPRIFKTNPNTGVTIEYLGHFDVGQLMDWIMNEDNTSSQGRASVGYCIRDPNQYENQMQDYVW